MNNMGSITFVRKKKVIGCIMPIDIYIDGLLYGSVKNNTTRQFFLNYGTHTLIAKSGYGETSFQFVINESQKNLVYAAELLVGFTVPIINLNLIQSYN